jgi:hypothetical protein
MRATGATACQTTRCFLRDGRIAVVVQVTLRVEYS